MADTDEKVMSLVKDELKKNPDISTQDLYEKAKAASSGIGKLTLRQFNARYPLQVKRKAGGTRKPRTRKTTAKKATRSARTVQASGGDGREAVRETFMRFASDLAGADDRGKLVKVLAAVDRYVGDVMKAVGR